MKNKIFFLAAASLCALPACQKASPAHTGGMSPEKEWANVRIELSNSLLTKATSAGEDNRINTAQVLVFDAESGICEAYGSATLNGSSGAVDIPRVRTGKAFACYAVANYPASLQQVSTLAELQALETDLKDYTPQSIPMAGGATAVFSQGEKSLDITLRRAASKIEVRKVTGAFTSSYYQQANCRLNALYLYKAPGKYTLGLEPPATQCYYHNGAYSGTDAKTLGTAAALVGDTSLKGTLTGNASYNTPHYFWCCPDTAEETYLTLEVSLDGKTNYYGIPLGTLDANCRYCFTDIRIYGPGADTPPGIVERVAIGATLSVSDWSTGYSQEYEF
ncbi:MAG: hypothetical protein J5871_00390 [Bacteroidales bacterium]|nr:hypothetical protein [Bacteroidales bacterium]